MRFKPSDILKDNDGNIWQVHDIKSEVMYIVPVNHDGGRFAKNLDGTYPFGMNNSYFTLVIYKNKKDHLPPWL